MVFHGQEIEELRSQVADLTDALTSERRTTGMQQETLEANRRTIDDQEAELRRLRVVPEVHRAALAALEEAESSGEVAVSAEELAVDTLTKRYIGEATKVQTERLLAEREREFRSTINGSRIDAIRTELDDTFTKDGTYDKLARKVELDVRDEVAGELKAAAEAKAREALEEPDKREAIVAEETAKLDASGEMDQIREEITRERHKVWAQEVKELATQRLAAEVEAGHDEYVADYAKKWRESYDGREAAENAKKHAEKKWSKATQEAIAQELQDEAVLELLRKKNDRTREELSEEQFYEENLADFFRGGVDVTQIHRGSTLSIRLGSLKIEDIKNEWNNPTGKKARVIECSRELRLTAMGEGRFMVNDDSLLDSNNPYEQAAALTAGTVIHVGRQEVDNHVATLVPQVAEGVPFFYDDDTSDPRITSCYLDVVDLGIDDVFAQKDITRVDRPNYKKSK